MNRYDLHTHSTASDGTLSPSELVRRAHSRGVEVMAITDHDCTDGIAEAMAEAEKVGLTLIPGVEMSVTWEEGQLLHVVGLRIDPGNPLLQEGLERLHRFRFWRAQEMGRRLLACGIAGAFEGARALAKGNIVSRTHFARFLVATGNCRDMNDAFERFLVPGKPGYVAGEWATLAECIHWIRKAGGQAVLAHPLRYPLTAPRLRRLFEQFRELGGEGIEVIAPNTNGTHTLAQHARTFGFAGSLGSDFHSCESPHTDIGLRENLPNGIRPIWEHW